MKTVTIIWVMTIGGLFHYPTNSSSLFQKYLIKDLNENYMTVFADFTYNPCIDSMNARPVLGSQEEFQLDWYLACRDTTYENPLKLFYSEKIVTVNDPPTLAYDEDDEDEDDDIPPQVIGKSAFSTPY
jgi:hypothetical protein